LILHVSQLQTQQMMTSQIRSHKIFNANLSQSCAHFILKTDEKSSPTDSFWYDLVMTVDSGLLFGTPYIYATAYTLQVFSRLTTTHTVFGNHENANGRIKVSQFVHMWRDSATASQMRASCNQITFTRTRQWLIDWSVRPSVRPNVEPAP